MTFRIRIEPENLRKIQQLIKEGLYKDEYDFITRAIKNQLQDDSEEIESGTAIAATAFSEPIEGTIYFNNVPISSEKITEMLETLSQSPAVKELREEDLQEELYGPGTSGLIWVFHNRFFPIKLALYELANMMATQKSNWVKLSDLKENTAERAARISEKLYKNENLILENLSIGLPAARKKLEKRYYGQRNKEEKISIRLNSSKKRFADQFVGRAVKKESKLEKTFSGAPYEMGLIITNYSDDNLMVSLTEDGKEFVTMKNPVLENIFSLNIGAAKNADKIFSKEEVDFILQKIIPQFELEKIIVDKILESKGNKLKPSEISQMFENKKRRYEEQKYKEKNLEEIREKYNVPEEEEVMDWIVHRHLDLQPTGTTGRLVELGLIKRELEGKEPYYSVV